ncbi:unnamed protein product, partial [Meganyctiphanes norvegica]
MHICMIQSSIVIRTAKKMSRPPKKRKREADTRNFQEYWTEDYYFIEHKGRPHCLICDFVLDPSCKKKSHLKRHYDTMHVSKNESACQLVGQMRTDKINKLRNKLESRPLVESW